jgi:AraC-like DNA-binding protein
MKVSKFNSDASPRWVLEPKWVDALSGLAKPGISHEQWNGFSGRVQHCETPIGIRLAVISGSPQQMSFTTRSEPDGVWLVQVLAGSAVLVDGQKRVLLDSNEIAHGSIRGNSILQFSDDFKFLLVRFPGAALNTRIMHQPQAMRMNTQNGIGRILSAMLKATSETIGDLPEDQGRAIESLLREFVIINLMVNINAASSGGLVGVQAALLQKAYQIIDARLSDPDLTMKKVAAELKISVRYLYKLFASSGEGFGRYVKRRRLDRCRCDLGNPVYANFNVSEICFRWGFNEAAHFSRVFREQFDISPRAWRKAAAAKRMAENVAHDPAKTPPVIDPHLRGGMENALFVAAE